ncbi:uncharacterized protein LOC127376930 isoform X1 [Dicentrarchus labrax]|uniref:uncharacterized protein LOC127376930 isoform X1 n=1 Tax=Dicentrarchus labrax TaxID=13489 RepID=UPI0021F63193|nr:uncharacterized protein LOC127376930 isoform X1 [Dicentrarchus labrax]
MKIHHSFIIFFFLSLQDGNTGFIKKEIPVRTGTEGGNITVGCSFVFIFSRERKVLCKEKCEGKDILIETTDNRAQRGRYSIEYKEGSFGLSSSVLYVSITKLTKSDSGRYRCWLDRRFLLDSSKDFELRVEDAPTASKPNWKTTTKAPFTPSVPSASTPTTTQSLSSSSGSSTPSSSSPETTNQPEQPQRAAGPGRGPVNSKNLLWKLSMLVSQRPTECMRRSESRTDRADLLLQKYLQCTLNTAASSQKKTSSKSTYSEVDFSNGAAAWPHSAPCGDLVVYSVPRVAASSHAEDASPPLYSTVSLHQL